MVACQGQQNASTVSVDHNEINITKNETAKMFRRLPVERKISIIGLNEQYSIYELNFTVKISLVDSEKDEIL